MPHVHRKGREPDEKRRSRAAQLYESGLSSTEISRVMKITRQAVRQLLLRQGVNLRPRGGNRGGGRRS